VSSASTIPGSLQAADQLSAGEREVLDLLGLQPTHLAVASAIDPASSPDFRDLPGSFRGLTCTDAGQDVT
jgi:hypothetical protein